MHLPSDITLHSHYHTQTFTVLGCLYPQDGFTALHLAAQKGNLDIVRLLTAAKAQINIQTEVHTRPLIWTLSLLERVVSIYMYI